MQEKTKDIEIDGQRYRVGLVSAMVGNWIVAQIQAGTYRTEDVFPSIQGHILEKCFRYKEVAGAAPVAQPIYGGGKVLMPDLADDLWALNRVYDAAVDFNFSPFFAKLDALNASSKAATEISSQQDSQTA
jgi:hypothetical protein